MNKKSIGIALAGLIVGSSVTVFAAGARKIEVYDNVKKVVVNNENKPFIKGREPFIYDGTTYVPLRYVSNALGEDVDWDSNTGTVYIGDRYSSAAHFWNKDLYDMGYKGSVSYTHDSSKYVANNINEQFNNYLRLSYGSHSGNMTSWAEFPLNGKYSEFNSSLSIPYDYRNFSYDIDVKILVDDRVAYQTTVKRGDMPRNVSVNLRGANKIKFSMTVLNNTYVTSSGGVMFGNGQFIKK